MRVFITGGSRGIGESLVKACVRAGHDVAFTYQSASARSETITAEARSLAPQRLCRSWKLDVSSSSEVDSVGESVVREFGGIDAVINNAAIIRIGMAATLPDRDWNEVIGTNLSGAFHVSRFFLNEFLVNGRGRFIHISSVARRGMNGQIGYSASKAGLEGLSGTLAKEYGRRNITSNVVSLGFFDTDMTRTQMAADRKRLWSEFCPAGRMGRLAEVSAAALFLMSDEAAFINGETINLTGGMDWVT